jgi:hypothetical protein
VGGWEDKDLRDLYGSNTVFRVTSIVVVYIEENKLLAEGSASIIVFNQNKNSSVNNYEQISFMNSTSAIFNINNVF